MKHILRFDSYSFYELYGFHDEFYIILYLVIIFKEIFLWFRLFVKALKTSQKSFEEIEEKMRNSPSSQVEKSISKFKSVIDKMREDENGRKEQAEQVHFS